MASLGQCLTQGVLWVELFIFTYHFEVWWSDSQFPRHNRLFLSANTVKRVRQCFHLSQKAGIQVNYGSKEKGCPNIVPSLGGRE